MMPQGLLPFQMVSHASLPGLTALGGLPLYLDLAHVARLRDSIRRHVQARRGQQGWTDAQMVMALMLMQVAGGKLPSGLFGANAAWWTIMVLALNLNTALKRLVLKGEWVTKRLKAIRYAIIHLPARVVRHARCWWIRLSDRHPSSRVLLEARERLGILARASPG